MKKGKTFGSLAARVLVITLIFISTTCIVAGVFLAGRALNTGVDLVDAIQKVPFENTSYAVRSIVSDGVSALEEDLSENQFKTDGSYDLTQTVDITKLGAGVSGTNKDDATSYTLGDLQKLYQDKNALNGLQSLLENAGEENYGESLITWQLQGTYGIDNFYTDQEGNLYASAGMGEVGSTNEAEEILNEATESELRFYKIAPDGTAARFNSNIDADANLTWIDDTEALGRLSVNLDEVNWDQNIPFDYSNYGETFWYLYTNGRQYENVLPQSGETLAVYALKHPNDVSIMDTYQELVNAAIEAGNALEADETEQSSVAQTDTPLAYYWFCDMDSGETYTNNPDWSGANESYDAIKASLQHDTELTAGGFCTTQSEWDVWTSDALSGNAKEEMRDMLSMEDHEVLSERAYYQIIVSMNKDLLDSGEYYDYFSDYAVYYSKYAGYVIPGVILIIGGAIAAIVFFIIAIIQAGRRDETKNRYASAFARNIPIEILLAVDIVSWIIYAVVAAGLVNVFTYTGAGWYSGRILSSPMVVMAICIEGFMALLLWQVLTLVCKGKSGNMRTNSLIQRFGNTIVNACKTVYRNRKVTGKLAICFVLFLVISIIGTALASWGIGIFILIILWAITFVILMQKCMQRQRVKDGIHEISGGNLDYQINEANLSGDDLDMAKDLNNVREGMQNAIQEQMKSERLKTDLITNVSHDIKTPLTSIINYVDILKKENIQDEKIRGYIDILDRKSQRLKHLTEDLVEASKISSGNIKLDIQEINLKQLLKQTNGEFEEKFARKNLTLVCTLPENQMLIRADGRRMWRVIENLYNNAAKYAMPNTRVYVDGEFKNGKVIVAIKNISEYPLNISADELMERFVRGDVSRNTEGSGLGLEIARNLTIMQKGTFEIYLDGDLFKVILTFDAI